MGRNKKSKYHFWEKIQEGLYLHYSSLSNQFLLLNEDKHNILENSAVEELEIENSKLYKTLEELKYIVPNDFDETDFITKARQQLFQDCSMYHVVVNTTLDCNLNCWYCYENKIKGSRLTDTVIQQICSNIECHYKNHLYRILKLSFFGGEPFMNWKGMKSIIDFAESFCKEKEIGLLLDFTTNATLITEKIIDYLSKFRCHFQITLDGSEQTHNEIKKSNNPNINSYRKTLIALRLINERIDNRNVALRINFDSRALDEIDNIIEDISFLDRKKSYVIVKKVWQVDREDVDVDTLLNVIDKLMDNDFLPDYYVMPKGGVCFAERSNQVLFNYDGSVFKCTTICSFDKENTLGDLNHVTNLVDWNEEKIRDWLSDMQQPECLRCKWYGACLGPCNRQLMAHKGKFICTFDAMNLSEKEYLMYLFKYQLLRNKLHSGTF